MKKKIRENWGKITIVTLCLMLVVGSILLMVLWPAQKAQAALTKTETTEALTWTLLTDTADAAGIKETGSIDVSDSYDTVFHIDVCGAEAGAHPGTQVIVQTSSEAGVDGSWTTLVEFVSDAVTFVKLDVNDVNTGAVLDANGIDTAHFNHDGKIIFCYDTGTIGNSDILYQISHDDGANTITCLDEPDHAQDTDCDLYTVDGDASGGNTSAVNSWPVAIPLAASQVRVIFNNWYGLGSDMNVLVRVRVVKATAL